MSREKSGGISVTTILIASASAATAAIVVPLIWSGGGVVAAAITPVIVTLVSESLKHPVEKVADPGVWRRTPQGTAVRQPTGRDFDPLDPEEERIEVDPDRTDDPFGLREPERGSGFFTRKKVTIALLTGAIAFGIAAVVVTAGELTFGDKTRPSQTRFWGGSSTATPTPTARRRPRRRRARRRRRRPRRRRRRQRDRHADAERPGGAGRHDDARAERRTQRRAPR